jgi:hypothetical protein
MSGGWCKRVLVSVYWVKATIGNGFDLISPNHFEQPSPNGFQFKRIVNGPACGQILSRPKNEKPPVKTGG